MNFKIILIVALMMLGTVAQKGKNSKGKAREGGLIDSIAFTLLGGPHDAPILTRLMNKLGQVGVVLGGAIFGYFKLFRKRKDRKERINSHLSEQLVKLTAKVDNQSEKQFKKAELFAHELAVNSQDARRTIGIHSANGQINFVIQIEVKDALEDSPSIYSIQMKGNDPQGISDFTGYMAFVGKGLEFRLEQTYPDEKKGDEPIIFFSGSQADLEHKVARGEWWNQNQKGTKGNYAGTWEFFY